MNSNIQQSLEEAAEVDLPNDAQERKRVLNVLAQRRYRKSRFCGGCTAMLILSGRRKKERQAQLEKTVQRLSNTGSSKASSSTPDRDKGHSPTACNASSQSSPPSSTEHTSVPNGPSQSCTTEPGNRNDITALGESLVCSPMTLDEVSNFLQEDDILQAAFADDSNLAVPKLDLLRAAVDIATRLNSQTLIWNLDASSVFASGTFLPWTASLPANLQPTSTQLSVPHHPALDILPWPRVRDRLIKLYALPEEVWPRHRQDGEPCSLVRFVYDMEDSGVRLWGEDPTSESGWEVEQDFVDSWWWALDWGVIKNANRRRRQRGQADLVMRR